MLYPTICLAYVLAYLPICIMLFYYSTYILYLIVYGCQGKLRKSQKSRNLIPNTILCYYAKHSIWCTLSRERYFSETFPGTYLLFHSSVYENRIPKELCRTGLLFVIVCCKSFIIHIHLGKPCMGFFRIAVPIKAQPLSVQICCLLR